ncbi:MAG: helix-turn-helix transcriptional regulator [Ktedonobacteraceae bacterium]|nr:helix-turn-helix transcriptional regulator [Ktedonobacteraceae bacterium]
MGKLRTPLYPTALIHCSGILRRGMSMFRLKVREVAKQKGVSQRQLFFRSGVDIKTIQKMFRDPHTVVTVETLARLAKVLEVDVSELIESESDDAGPEKEA